MFTLKSSEEHFYNMFLSNFSLWCRKAMAEKYIMTAAKLIAPVIETSFAVGYDW